MYLLNPSLMSKISYNSEFSFIKTGYPTEAKEPSLSYYLLIAKREKIWIYTFPKGISTKWNMNSFAE